MILCHLNIEGAKTLRQGATSRVWIESMQSTIRLTRSADVLLCGVNPHPQGARTP